MRILISGIAGFIGSHLADRLIKDGHEVLGIDNLSTGRKEYINKKAKLIKENIINQDVGYWVRVMEDANVGCVFHQAALPRIQLSLDNPNETFEANVYATSVILEASRLAGVKKFIYASSSSVYGKVDELGLSRRFLPLMENMPCDPLSPYAVQKYMSELLCKSYAFNFGLDVVVLRYFNVYGKRMSATGVYKLVMAIWKEQKRKGKPLTVFGDGEQTRDFTYIDDVVEANILAMNTKSVGKDNFQVFNVCSGEEISVNKIARMFNHEIKFVPNPRGKWEEIRKVGSYQLIKDLLNFEPKVFIEEGIKKYLS